MSWSSADLAIVLLSVKVAAVATVVTLPLAVAVALLLARTRFWGRSLVNAIVHLPLVVPPVVTGYLLLTVFGRRGPVGAFIEDVFGFTFAFRWTGAALAAGLMGFPLMVRAIRQAIESVDRRYEEAAWTLGASHGWTLAAVTLPLALPGVLVRIDPRDSRRHWVSSARRSRSSRTSLARHRRWRSPSTASRRCRAAKCISGGWSVCRSRSLLRRCSSPSCWRDASNGGSVDPARPRAPSLRAPRPRRRSDA